MKTIDAHAAGEPLRLIVDGFPSPRGRTMLDRGEWLKRHADHLRRALMLEPRGHADMYGAILTEPVSPGSHVGVLFMHNAGFSTMCGHGIVAVTTIALERGLLMPGGDGTTVVYDSPAGTIRAKAAFRGAPAAMPSVLGEASASGSLEPTPPSACGPSEARSGRARASGGGAPRARKDVGPRRSEEGGAPRESKECRDIRVSSVSFVSVPSFVVHGGLAVKVGTRHIRVDVAFGGAFYAIVDSEAAGLPIDAAHLPELRRAGMEIKRAVEAAQTIAHPLEPGLTGLYGTIFTGPPSAPEADLRNVAIFADAAVDRSPCGTGTCAVMAVVDAMGLLSKDKPFVHESLIGTRFLGRVAGRTTVGEYQAIVPEIEGSAWITGEHTFFVDDADPLREGFRV